MRWLSGCTQRHPPVPVRDRLTHWWQVRVYSSHKTPFLLPFPRVTPFSAPCEALDTSRGIACIQPPQHHAQPHSTGQGCCHSCPRGKSDAQTPNVTVIQSPDLKTCHNTKILNVLAALCILLGGFAVPGASWAADARCLKSRRKKNTFYSKFSWTSITAWSCG